VGPELAGIRVDTLLKRHLGLSGTVVRRIKWLSDGILVDGRRVNTRYAPRAGEVLSVCLSDPERRSGIVPAPGPLDIVYEDPDLLVLNKASGVAVHPGPGHYNDTIGNFLLHYYDSRGEEGDFHPVHRLDRGTSGLMVVARHPHAQEILKRQLHTADFHRTYLAVCEGAPEPPAGTVDAPLGPREAGPHPVRDNTAGRGCFPAPSEAGDRANSPDPGPSRLAGPSPGGGLPLWPGGSGVDPAACPALCGALLPPPHHREAAVLFPAPPGRYGGPFGGPPTIRRSFLPLNISTQWRPGGLSPV